MDSVAEVKPEFARLGRSVGSATAASFPPESTAETAFAVQQTTHESEEQNRETPNEAGPLDAAATTTRAPLTRACDACRASHTKCDGAERCLNCTRKLVPCVYSKAKRRGRKPASYFKEQSALAVGDPWTSPSGALLATDFDDSDLSFIACPPKRVKLDERSRGSDSPSSASRHDRDLFAAYIHAYLTSIDYLFNSFAPVPVLSRDLAAYAETAQALGIEEQAKVVTLCAIASIGSIISDGPRSDADELLQIADGMTRGDGGLLYTFANVTVAGSFFMMGYAYFTYFQMHGDMEEPLKQDGEFDDDGDFPSSRPHAHVAASWKCSTFFILARAICENMNILNSSVLGLSCQMMRLISNGSLTPQQRRDGFAHIARSAFGVCSTRMVFATVQMIQECIKHELVFDVEETTQQLEKLLAGLPTDLMPGTDTEACVRFLRMALHATLGWVRLEKGTQSSSALTGVIAACDQMDSMLKSPRPWPPCFTSQFVRLLSLLRKSASVDPSVTRKYQPCVDTFVATLPWRRRVQHILRHTKTMHSSFSSGPQTAPAAPIHPFQQPNAAPIQMQHLPFTAPFSAPIMGQPVPWELSYIFNPALMGYSPAQFQ